jgi:ribose transport system ATP-binding protein
MSAIAKTFGGTRALDGVDLTVAGGEIHALVGENGAGKSTLMKILSGAVPPDSGAIALDDRPYSPASTAEGRSSGVAMIYQELSIAPHLSVERNISLGLEPGHLGLLDKGEIRRRASAALGALGHGNIPCTSPAGSLPLAERQIVEIARALATGCRVLVLDEPTSSLSPSDRENLFRVLRRLREEGTAIVYISHYLEEVLEISDRYTVLRDGRVADSGKTRDARSATLVRSMVGRNVEERYPRSRRDPGEPLLQVRDLGGDLLPQDATFTLRRGEILGIAGLIGAGRTELLRTIFGLDPVRRGEILIGLYRGPAAPPLRWQQGAGMVSEERAKEGLALRLGISRNITLGMRKMVGRGGWYSPARLDAQAWQWCARLGIRADSPAQEVSQLSGGNQQKVALARLLYEDVDLLLLDEPTRGIDVGSKEEIYRILDRLASGGEGASRPRGVLLVSSYPPELLGICDRVAVMARGVLAPSRPTGEWNEHSLLLAMAGEGEPA